MKYRYCSPRPLLNKCSLESCAYQIDPYIGCAHLCHYCYALKGAETDWSQEILYYEDIEAQLTSEIEGIPPQQIYMGWETDPYQPCEENLKQTRKALEVLHSRGFSVSILTKSNLVLRDLDILTSMGNANISMSVAFDDEDTRELFECNTMPTQVRIEALKECKQAGLHVSAMVCPIIPFVNNPIPTIAQVAPFVDKVWVFGLSILDESETNWINIDKLLQENYPESYDKIQSAILDKSHPFWTKLRTEILDTCSQGCFELSVHI